MLVPRFGVAAGSDIRMSIVAAAKKMPHRRAQDGEEQPNSETD